MSFIDLIKIIILAMKRKKIHNTLYFCICTDKLLKYNRCDKL